MAKIIDLKPDRIPKKGEEVELGNWLEGDRTLAITRKDDFRCWLRIELTEEEQLSLIRDLLSK